MISPKTFYKTWREIVLVHANLKLLLYYIPLVYYIGIFLLN